LFPSREATLLIRTLFLCKRDITVPVDSISEASYCKGKKLLICIAKLLQNINGHYLRSEICDNWLLCQVHTLFFLMIMLICCDIMLPCIHNGILFFGTKCCCRFLNNKHFPVSCNFHTEMQSEVLFPHFQLIISRYTSVPGSCKHNKVLLIISRYTSVPGSCKHNKVLSECKSQINSFHHFDWLVDCLVSYIHDQNKFTNI